MHRLPCARCRGARVAPQAPQGAGAAAVWWRREGHHTARLWHCYPVPRARAGTSASLRAASGPCSRRCSSRTSRPAAAWCCAWPRSCRQRRAPARCLPVAPRASVRRPMNLCQLLGSDAAAGRRLWPASCETASVIPSACTRCTRGADPTGAVGDALEWAAGVRAGAQPHVPGDRAGRAAAPGAPQRQGQGRGRGRGRGPAPPGDPAHVELTDGWYGVRAVLDAPLTALLAAGRLQPGAGVRL